MGWVLVIKTCLRKYSLVLGGWTLKLFPRLLKAKISSHFFASISWEYKKFSIILLSSKVIERQLLHLKLLGQNMKTFRINFKVLIQFWIRLILTQRKTNWLDKWFLIFSYLLWGGCQMTSLKDFLWGFLFKLQFLLHRIISPINFGSRYYLPLSLVT